MADPATLISALLSNLVPVINDEFKLIWSCKEEVEKLRSTQSSILAKLEDAEIKNVWKKDRQTEDWLRKLKDVAYEVRDIMDECSFEDLRLQVKRLNASSSTLVQVTNSITHHFSSIKMRKKVGHKIKEVREKLDQVSSERQNLHFSEPNPDSKKDKFTRSWRETMSLLPNCMKVYGRDKEKEEIIGILLNNTSSVSTELSVLPIVGIGGLGKTTLAQMVFNDSQVSNYFDPKIWVCVSDEFDIKLVIKAIIGETNETSLEILQKKVQDKLKGKRYLIVLDDVWNENKDEWIKLRSILDCGSNGAFVLTTTRKEGVAKIMETNPHFELSVLSFDECWLLIKERAFEPEKSKDSNFINIGMQIAQKCKGVPLVAKTLGSQLGFADDEKEWRRIRDSEIWEISENEKDLLPILRLSYYDLPYHLRRCFVFCAIFPKDTVIKKKRLIQLWMAHGLIPTDKKQDVEDVGNTIWKELSWRSFFQDEKENTDWSDEVDTTFKMHDLMHDLAQSIMQDYRGMQSILFHGTPQVPPFVRNVRNEILSILKEFPSLRVFQISNDNVRVQYKNLHYVGRLKHLRYLDISKSKITTLSNSICDLLNLQTLNLSYCSRLKSLPRNMKNLINLRHLYLEYCHELSYMPRGMGRLKHLKTLSLFLIGKKQTYGQLDELKELDIGGSLTIRHLSRVSDASIVKGISMAKKTSMNVLELDWGYTIDYVDIDADRHEKIGEALEVSTARLEILRMSGYKGVKPPKWVGKTSPSPTHLKSSESSAIKDDNEMIVLFPLLEKLHISSMKNLREFVSPSSLSTGAFANLFKLEISYCPKLVALPPHLKALKYVSVFGECSDELLNSISNLSALTRLYIEDMEERSVLFGAGKALMLDDEIPSSSSSSQILGDNNNNNNEAAQLGLRSTFQSLQSLCIWSCKKLRRLFDDEGMIMEETWRVAINTAPWQRCWKC